MLLALVLCLLLGRAKSDDGCTNDEEGNARWKCGDICIRVDTRCQCGNTTIAISDTTWCCGTGCGSDMLGSDGSCPTGEVLPLTQTCRGECNHQAPTAYWHRYSNLYGVRSHDPVQCDNITRCLPEQVCTKWDDFECVSRAPYLCTGAPVCNDRKDVEACWVDENSKVCHMEHGWSSTDPDPSFKCKNGPCVFTDTGVYDCPLRDDEATNPNIPDKESIGEESDESQDQEPHMEPCLRENDPIPGLMCGGICENALYFCDPNYKEWLSPECRNDSSVNRTNISAMKQICDLVPHMEPCALEDDGELTPGLMCGGQCESFYEFCDPDNKWEADLSPECRNDSRVTRENICQNQIFAGLAREFYKRKTPGQTLCEGALPGETYLYTDQICDGTLFCQDGGDEVCRDGKDNAVDEEAREVIDRYTLCSDNRTRISPRLVCDGVHQCPGWDRRDEDATACRQNYERLGIAPALGYYECVSGDLYRHPNISILSVRCDGQRDCLGGSDEENCEDSSLLMTFIVAISALPAILFLCWTGYNRWSLKPRMVDDIFYGPQTRAATSMTELLELLLSPKPEISSTSKNLMEYSGQEISTAFFHIERMDYNNRKSATKRFMDSTGRTGVGLMWMKINLHPDAVSFILLNCDESFIGRLSPNWIKTKFLGAAGPIGQVLAVLKSCYASFSINLDLFVDCGLLVVLYQLLTEQENMGGLLLIVLCAMASVIFLPMFYDYCLLFENRTSNEKFRLFCCFPIFPLVTHSSTLIFMCRRATIQLEIDSLTMSTASSSILGRKILANKICESADELTKQVNALKDVKDVIDERRLLETSAEGQPQLYIKGILLLLTLSWTQSAYIPATIFGKNIEFFGIPSKLILMVFTVNPILMNGNYYLGIIYKKRTIVGSIFLILFIFTCILAKFVSIVTVFSPPLGLFSILGHWKEQQTPFSCKVMTPPNGDGFFYGVVQGVVTRTNWTDIGGPLCKRYGADYVDIESGKISTVWRPEDISSYFLFDLKATCFFVALVTIARLMAIYKAKLWFASDFSRETSFVRIKHLLYSGTGAVSLTWSNWEVANSLPNISRVLHIEHIERMILLTIHLIENILLLLPMVFTYSKIQARHTILENSIGATKLENISYTNAFQLVAGSFFVVLLCFVTEIILFPVYYRYAHIWKELLNQARLTRKEKKSSNLNLKEVEIFKPVKKRTGEVEQVDNVANNNLDENKDEIKAEGGSTVKMYYEFSVETKKQ